MTSERHLRDHGCRYIGEGADSERAGAAAGAAVALEACIDHVLTRLFAGPALADRSRHFGDRRERPAVAGVLEMHRQAQPVSRNTRVPSALPTLGSGKPRKAGRRFQDDLLERDGGDDDEQPEDGSLVCGSRRRAPIPPPAS